MSTLVTSNIKHSGSASNNVELDSSGNLKFNSGYGSAEVAYGCRAWVNFNGTTATPSTIRGSGNVSSVTRNSTGNYTVNFTTAMPDTNYVVSALSSRDASTSQVGMFIDQTNGPFTTSVTVSELAVGTFFNVVLAHVAIFR